MSKQANAIDISEFQDPSTFDYQAVKDAGIDTLIIRAGYHTRQDKHVKEHIANAKQYGFKWHLYHYWMNGDNEAEWAVQNAQSLGLTSKQYLFLDMEDKTLPTNWGEQFTQFRQVAGQNFQVGLYCSDSPYKAKFDDDQLRQLGVMRWVASYSYEPKNYDIWQISGAGGGGFGKYTKDVDRDYVANSALNVYAEATKSDEPAEKPFTPPTDLPESIKNIVLQDMVVDGIRGLGCSADNGVTNRIYWTILGRKYYQEDGDRIWPFLVDKVKSVMSVSWDQIQGKPVLVTKGELDQRLSSLDIPSVDGLAKQNELDDVKATADSAKSKAEQAQSTANSKVSSNYQWSVVAMDYNDIKTAGVYYNAENGDNYHAPAGDWGYLIVNGRGNGACSQLYLGDNNAGLYWRTFNGYDWWSNWVKVASTNDLSGLVSQSALNQVKDLLNEQIAKKADASAIPSLDGYAKLTDIPSITGLVKESELDNYALKKDIPTIPDLSGYATVSSLVDYAKKTDLPDLTSYALKTDIPQSMTWQQITGKPDVATQDDIDYLKTLIGSSGGSGDAGLTIEAIVELIKHHLKARVDAKTGNLLIDVDDVSNGSIADAVATKVAQALKFKLQGNELIAEIGGTE